MSKRNWFDTFTASFAPKWTLERMRARLAMRAYEAAQPSRRTSGWNRNRGDVNAVTAAALGELRMHARDLIRNNAWARRGQRVIANNTVGWGIVPKAVGANTAQAMELWKAWADSTQCDSTGRLTFYGLQHLAMKSIAESGEVLFRRRGRRDSDGLAIPLQLEVLEADYLDTTVDGIKGPSGGPIIQGVEFDMLGRRVAYWLFNTHPGSNIATAVSRRVPAADILHVFYSERPGQVRGPSWFGAAIVNLKDLDEYEDAELMKQKVAACFSALVTDLDGQTPVLGEEDEDDSAFEKLEPGAIIPLPPGRQVTMANPPSVTDTAFTTRNLRRIAAGIGVTYEDLTGDYSNVNFSSARMARLAHWANVYDWQWHMLIPTLCNGVWAWAMEAAGMPGLRADWTAPPMPMIEPDKEGLAYQRLVRNGTMTHDEMVRERGGDPEAHWAEYAAGLAKLDALKIKLDSDTRAVSQAGLTQERAGAGGKPPAESTPASEERATGVDEDPELSNVTPEDILR